MTRATKRAPARPHPRAHPRTVSRWRAIQRATYSVVAGAFGASRCEGSRSLTRAHADDGTL
jgi:hypothetical protein